MSRSLARILREYSEINSDPPEYWTAYPLEISDPKLWHFVMRGGVGTPFENGLYHGRIFLPDNYPLEPPSIQFDTPNGRWEVGTKACFNATAHHPELWQPAWSIRSLMDAINAYMLVDDTTSVGAMGSSDAERKRLAIRSRHFKCSACGLTNEEIIAELPTIEDAPKNEVKPGLNQTPRSRIAPVEVVGAVTPVVSLSRAIKLLFQWILMSISGQKKQIDNKWLSYLDIFIAANLVFMLLCLVVNLLYLIEFIS